MFDHERLWVYAKALGAAKKVPDLIARWPKGHADLEDQLERAMASVVLNISEGNGRTGAKERRRFFTISRGSANECAAVMDVAVAFRLMEPAEAIAFKSDLLEIVKMLYKLR